MDTIEKNVRFNFVVNVLDGAFFGLAIGFASFGTNIPLFLKQFTVSAVLIGLIPAIHVAGLQFPPLFTLRWVVGRKRYKPLVMLISINERLPFLGLAAIAWSMYALSPTAAVALIFGMLTWQGLGGGFGMVAWQSMLIKVLPGNLIGTFFGVQAAAFSILASISAILAGVWLDAYGARLGFTLIFVCCFAALVLSYIMVGLTREPASVPPPVEIPAQNTARASLLSILRQDANFRWFLLVRMLAQLATMAPAFYMVYVVEHFGASKTLAGVLTSVMLITQIVANPLMGWFGDRWSHYLAMGFGLSAAILSASVAWLAPSVGWFYLVVVFTGIANVAIWTISMAMTLEFGRQTDRQAYIGLANTLIAPFTILAPIVGGWLADRSGYTTTFLVSGICGVVTLLVFILQLRDPRRK